MLYNTFNIHENMAFVYTKIYVFCLKKIFKLCSFNDQKHI